MTARVFVARDSSAVSVGADEVAQAIATQAARSAQAVEIVRTGSRGLMWLEPLVEVQTPQGRVAYGPVRVQDVAGLFASGFLRGARHALAHGPTEQIAYLAHQERRTFARVGRIDPLSLDEYLAHGGYTGLRRALALGADAAVQTVVDSGLRGRGGAAFPTGIKWKTVLDQTSATKYVVCNADEGDSGTFCDRMLLEGDPFALIEGMTIAGVSVGARDGYVYVRSEYPSAEATLAGAIAAARAGGFLGADVAGSGRRFDLQVRRGAGAYICGEETSLLESLEGKRGMVRFRPPLPAVQGLFGKPTLINNVITLATVPSIFSEGAQAYRDFGVGRSRGTSPFQLAGNIRRAGLVEKAFGVTLRELLYEFGGGSASGRPIRAVQIGGPLGAYVPESQFDTAMDYEALAAKGAMLGHGGIVAFDDTANLAQMARFAMEFCALESCGKCTPCRIGSTRAVELIDRIRARPDDPAQVDLLHELCETMSEGSLCALGGMAPAPVRSVLKHFPGDFGLTLPSAGVPA